MYPFWTSWKPTHKFILKNYCDSPRQLWLSDEGIVSKLGSNFCVASNNEVHSQNCTVTGWVNLESNIDIYWKYLYQWWCGVIDNHEKASGEIWTDKQRPRKPAKWCLSTETRGLRGARQPAVAVRKWYGGWSLNLHVKKCFFPCVENLQDTFLYIGGVGSCSNRLYQSLSYHYHTAL